CEAEVRVGNDVEAVHDMRVAARRMRSAFRLLHAYYDGKILKGTRQPLRALAHRLGAVRDRDVLIENAHTYAATLTTERQAAFEPLMTDWSQRRQEAHDAAIDFLDGKKYDAWKARMKDFLGADVDHAAPRVCEEVPTLVWEHYTAVRAYEPRIG